MKVSATPSVCFGDSSTLPLEIAQKVNTKTVSLSEVKDERREATTTTNTVVCQFESEVPSEEKKESQILYWAKSPPELSKGCLSPLFFDLLCHNTYLGAACPLVPYMWPCTILCCLGISSCYEASILEHEAKEKYWIITDSEVIRITSGTQKHLSLDSPAILDSDYQKPTMPSVYSKVQNCCLTNHTLQASRFMIAPYQEWVDTTDYSGNIYYDAEHFVGCPPEFHNKLIEAKYSYIMKTKSPKHALVQGRSPNSF